jgi:nuclear pore complex protein Nup188
MASSKPMAVLPELRYLFFALEDAAAQGLSPATLHTKLDDSADFLSRCLSSYLPPSAASRAAVESGSVRYGSVTLSLGASIRAVTVAAAARIALDEVQTYALLRRCVEEDKGAMPTECDDDLVERLTHFYFRERLGMLKCIHALLIRAVQADEGEDGHGRESFGAPMAACLERILRDGLEDSLTGLLCSHMRGTTPTRPQPSGMAATAAAAADACQSRSQAQSPAAVQMSRDWAGQALEETQVMLECTFLMYYDQRTKCSAQRFAQLASAFEAGALGRAPVASAELVRYGGQAGGIGGEAVAAGHVRAFTDSLRALCVVILVEALDLEGIVEQIQLGGGEHVMLSEDAFREVGRALAQWPSDAVHGPVLLAWATLLALAPTASAASAATAATATLTLPAEADANAAAARAASGDAGFSSLLSLLRLDQLRDGGGGETHANGNVNATLHKSVLKNLLTSSLAAFDVLPVHRLRPAELSVLLDVLRELTAGQPMLCEQFWGGARLDGQEAPLLALLVGCRERHPADAVPLLRALAALAEGPRAAECALAFLARLPGVALPVPRSGVDGAQTAGAIVPLGLDGAPIRAWAAALRQWEGKRGEWERSRQQHTRRGGVGVSGRGGMGIDDPPPPPPLPPGPVRAVTALASPFLPGAYVPRGTRGVALGHVDSAALSATVTDDDETGGGDGDAAMTTAAVAAAASGCGAELVTWDAPADGIRMLIARLCVLSTAGAGPSGATAEGGPAVGTAEAAELDATLVFISRVLTSAPSFAAKLVACDVSAAVPHGTPPSLLAALAAVVTAATSPGAAWATLACTTTGSSSEEARHKPVNQTPKTQNLKP